MQRTRKTVERTLRYMAKDVGKRKVTEKQKQLTARHEWEMYKGQVDKEWNKNARQARKAQREDWQLGPLAPNRAAGWDANIRGALVREEISTPRLPEHMRRPVFAIKAGDRVAIIKGKDAGKIGTVENVDRNKDRITVRDLNKAYYDSNILATPPPAEDGGEPPARFEQSLPMPYSNVRLVHAFYDHRDGQYKEVIVDKVKMVPRLDEFGEQRKDVLTGEDEFDRYIPGMDVRIPWPEDTGSMPQEQAADTPGVDVELPTFEPSLLTPPMPLDAVDEIRNPYKPSRQDHTDEFLAKREQMEKERQEREASVLQVRTPLQELKAQREAARKAQGDTVRRTVPDEVLEKLGAVIRARGKTEHVKSAWIQKEAANRKRVMEEQRRQKHRVELMQLREEQKERNYKPKPKTYVV